MIAIAASVHQERLCREISGDDVIYVPWQRPGFDIGLRIESLIRDGIRRPKGLFLGSTRYEFLEQRRPGTCYETALEIINRGAAFHRATRPRRDRPRQSGASCPSSILPESVTLIEILPLAAQGGVRQQAVCGHSAG